MDRFILRYNNTGPTLAEATDRLEALPNTRIVDMSARMLLIQAPDAMRRTLESLLPGWTIARERIIPLPITQPAPL